ncbi:MAG: protein-L-isoaspartate(D-aspartate) O-methyltransferase [Pseudomonadota bacterium]
MTGDTDEFAAQRDRLIQEIALEMHETAPYIGRAGLTPHVEAALRAVPRQAFVPDETRDLAYINRPLPIGHGQTISQPFIVAAMTELLDIGAETRVLEIGTGCGYQTAVLAELAARVYTVEVIPALARRARERLEALGCGTIEYRIGDGSLGWPEAAPFDRIIVTAAAADRPRTLIDQLALGGRMVAPIGGTRHTQVLTVLDRTEDGRIVETPTLPVAFVPLVGKG